MRWFLPKPTLIREQPNLKLRLSEEDYEAVKSHAVANERSVAAELRFIVKQYLKGAK